MIVAACLCFSRYGLVRELQTLTATADEKCYGLHNRTHPLPLDRWEHLDAAMGTRSDKRPGLIDEISSFVSPYNSRPLSCRPAWPSLSGKGTSAELGQDALG